MATALIVIIILWIVSGILTNILLKKEKLPPLYRVLLFLEGLIGLLFYLMFKGAGD
ncbi:hypothetical protein [Caldisericum exile]|uniref:Uncharacterized protein n=1 Tax=Caldisericum exile (strain DSM 21853 / NBRC 104410 / AZM16c01) TaxID=511051 RepID=A0A7U6JGA0_CALEA|nr:hypothetical protein [Caldisericum exile]BAL81200.1 hypothetical protein CSE_10740 [Caldisericum exile AZM16c01]